MNTTVSPLPTPDYRLREADGVVGSVSVATMTPNSDAGAPQFGCEVSALPPRQAMFVADTLAGGPPEDRTASPAAFTGGDTESGLGGSAIAGEPGKPESAAGVTVNRGQAIGI